MTPLHNAAIKGSFELCKFMLENISMKNPANNWGDTPFHFAVKYNRFEICKLFIANFDDTQSMASIWETAKDCARSLRHLKILKLLNEEHVGK